MMNVLAVGRHAYFFALQMRDFTTYKSFETYCNISAYTVLLIRCREFQFALMQVPPLPAATFPAGRHGQLRE